jgi:hypothetical protein
LHSFMCVRACVCVGERERVTVNTSLLTYASMSRWL